MAFGEETALLEIEVDTSAFDKVEREHAKMQATIARDVERGAAAFERAKAREAAAATKATRSILQDLERGTREHEAAMARQQRATDKAQKKMAIAAAASIAAWKTFFDFLESGNGRGAKSFEQLEGQLDRTKGRIAEAVASSGPMQTLRGLLDTISRGATSSAHGIRILGEAIGALAAPPVAVLSALERLGAAAPRNVGRGLRPGERSTASRVTASQRALEDRPNLLYGSPTVQLPEQTIEGGAPRGGGGGGRQRDPVWERMQAAERARQEAARISSGLDGQERESITERARRVGQEIQDTLRNNTQVMDGIRAVHDTRVETSEAEHELRQRAAADRDADWEAEKSVYLQRMALLGATTSAIGQAAGQWADALGAGAAARLVIVGIEETVLAAAAWAKVANPFGGQVHIPEAIAHTSAAALAFARAGGLGGGGGGGGGASRPSGGGGGASSSRRDSTRDAAFAPPRDGSGQSGSQVINQTFVVNAAGEVVDDGTLRRLSASVNEARRRGYS